LPGIHSPKIWVDRADAEHAAAILQEHEQREAELRTAPPPADEDQQVQTVCEECGGFLAFPASQHGSVQECVHCGSYVDVVAEEEVNDWDSEDGEA
jgi:hypothetical protein